MGIHWEVTWEITLGTTRVPRKPHFLEINFIMALHNDFLCHHSKWEIVDHYWQDSSQCHFYLKISGYRHLAKSCLDHLSIEGQLSVLKEMSNTGQSPWDITSISARGIPRSGAIGSVRACQIHLHLLDTTPSQQLEEKCVEAVNV